MKFLSNFLARFRKPKGITSIPGESVTVASGKFRLPRVDWEKLYRKSFLYNSVASVICGYFMADLLVAGFNPYFPPTEAPRARAAVSTSRDFMAYSMVIMPNRKPNLFNKDGLIPNNDDGKGDRGGQPVKTSLPLTLTGVIVLGDSSKSVASIEDKGVNQVIAVRVGENITAAAVVESITESQVVFFNQDTQRMEFVELPLEAAGGPRRVVPERSAPSAGKSQNITIPKAELTEWLGPKFPILLTQARCTQVMENSKPAGYQCIEIEPGSLYEKLGLKNKDIVTSIDNAPLDNIQELIAKLERLRAGGVSEVEITVTRDGKPVNMMVRIPPQ